MKFVEENTRAVFKSRHFVEMSADTFAFILQSDNLQIDEVDVLASVKEWGTVNSVVTGQTMADTLKGVVEHVRFPLLDEATLQKIEEDNEKTPIIPVLVLRERRKKEERRKQKNGVCGSVFCIHRCGGLSLAVHTILRFGLTITLSLHSPPPPPTVAMQVKLIAKAWKFQATRRTDPTDPHFRPRAGTHNAM